MLFVSIHTEQAHFFTDGSWHHSTHAVPTDVDQNVVVGLMGWVWKCAYVAAMRRMQI